MNGTTLIDYCEREQKQMLDRRSEYEIERQGTRDPVVVAEVDEAIAHIDGGLIALREIQKMVSTTWARTSCREKRRDFC